MRRFFSIFAFVSMTALLFSFTVNCYAQRDLASRIVAQDAVTIVGTDLVMIVDDPGGTPLIKKITWANLQAAMATVGAIDIDAGSSGVAGSVDIFPTTASMGKLSFTAAESAGDTTTAIVNASQAGARTYTIPDAGASASFVMTAGAQTIAGVKTFSSGLLNTGGAGTANGTGNVATEAGDGVTHKTTLTFTNTPVTLVDQAGVTAYGSLKVYDMPEGVIQFLGVTADFTAAGSSLGIDVDAAGDFGLGTVAANNDATPLATTEQNLIANTSMTYVDVGGVGSEDVATYGSLVAAAFDGSASAMGVYVNFLVDDGDQDVTSTPCNVVLNGTITLTWVNLGDY